MLRSVSKKMGVKESMSAIFINAPAETVEAMDLPNLVISEKLTGDFDYIHFFTKTQKEFHNNFSRLKTHLKPNGMLWVSWPKNKQLDTDLTLPKVINFGYDYGLVESTCLSVDSTWSALKFTHPKKGKVYHNSFGKLNRDIPPRE